MTPERLAQRDRLDAAWAELVADALASDGRISDADVKNAVKRNRPHIEDAARLIAADVRVGPDEGLRAIAKSARVVAAYEPNNPTEGHAAAIADLRAALDDWSAE